MIPSPAEMMEVEKRHSMRRHSGLLEDEIRQRWNLTATRWAQLVLAALDDGTAYKADPATAVLCARRIQARRRRPTSSARP